MDARKDEPWHVGSAHFCESVGYERRPEDNTSSLQVFEDTNEDPKCDNNMEEVSQSWVCWRYADEETREREVDEEGHDELDVRGISQST